MTPNKPAGKKEGGINLKSRSARISGSKVAGRDHIEGISAKEFNEIIKTLLKHFPKGYLRNPEKLDQTLKDFRKYHERLHEYKELHNGIHEIQFSFDPFISQINTSKSIRVIPELDSLRTRWDRVSYAVTSLLDWSRQIQHIAEPFQDKDTGPEWAIKFCLYNNFMNVRLGIADQQPWKRVEDTEYPSKLQILSYQKFGVNIAWWDSLIRETALFNNAISEYMYVADKHLRHTAQELFNLSHRALLNY